jgi:hypothetical protein
MLNGPNGGSGKGSPRVYVFDYLAKPVEGIDPGHYYSFMTPHIGQEIDLTGPFPTSEAAQAAAVEEFEEAMTGIGVLPLCHDEPELV